jgi:hypothetical protein
MNGRVFDYNVGRFTGVDPFIQFPLNSQSLNPYSYILNNPLSGTDPTGYCTAETGSHIKTCVDVQVKLDDGSTKSIGSYNTRSAGDMASAYRSAAGVLNQSNGSSSSAGTKSEARDQRDTSGDFQSASKRENAASGVPKNVEAACQSYQGPASCGLDDAINNSAKTGVAAGTRQLDPAFRNPAVAAGSKTIEGVVHTTLGYEGSVDDKIVQSAEKDWTGNGKDVQMSLVRQPEGSNGLRINMIDTPGMAAKLGLCTCTTAYWVAGHTDLENNQIVLNQDRDSSVQREALKHELGHYFFGKGHPTLAGQLGFGGIMQYGGNRIKKEDRQRYKSMYMQAVEASP